MDYRCSIIGTYTFWQWRNLNDDSNFLAENGGLCFLSKRQADCHWAKHIYIQYIIYTQYVSSLLAKNMIYNMIMNSSRSYVWNGNISPNIFPPTYHKTLTLFQSLRPGSSSELSSWTWKSDGSLKTFLDKLLRFRRKQRGRWDLKSATQNHEQPQSLGYSNSIMLLASTFRLRGVIRSPPLLGPWNEKWSIGQWPFFGSIWINNSSFSIL